MFKGSSKWTMNPSLLPKLWQKLLEDNNVKELEWPSQSSDLSPIETLWAELKKHLRARRPTNLTVLSGEMA